MPIGNAMMRVGAGISAAASELGLGSLLQMQQREETDEQRRRRLMLDQMQEAVNPLGAPSMLGLSNNRRKAPIGY